VAAAAVGIQLFLVTQDLNGAMIVVDRYTVIQAVIFAIGFMSALFAVTRKRGEAE
jgi:hypothetical protein